MRSLDKYQVHSKPCLVKPCQSWFRNCKTGIADVTDVLMCLCAGAGAIGQ